VQDCILNIFISRKAETVAQIPKGTTKRKRQATTVRASRHFFILSVQQFSNVMCITVFQQSAGYHGLSNRPGIAILPLSAAHMTVTQVSAARHIAKAYCCVHQPPVVKFIPSAASVSNYSIPAAKLTFTV